MKEKQYPRVLVVSAAGMNNKSATGLTLMSLFRGWPTNNIAQIQEDSTSPDPIICENYKQVSSHDVPGFKAAKTILEYIRRSDAGNYSLSPKYIDNFKYPARSAWLDMVPIKFSETLSRWLDDFKPEIVYSVLGNIRMMNISLRISKRFSIPIVPHFMDDWPTTRYSLGLSNMPPRKLLLSELKNVFTRSPLGLTISEAMAQEYTKRYEKQFIPFMKCVPVNTEKIKRHKDTNSKKVTFGYVGGLHLNRWQSLEHVASSLLKISRDGHNVELAVFAPAADIERYGSLFDDNPVVNIYGTLPPEKVSAAIEKFNVSVHIESFDDHDALYTRLSISTKIPQYMAAGRPILAYGPLSLASCKHINDCNCGIVVGAQDGDVMDEAVKCLVVDSDLRYRYGENARKAAISKHGAADVQRKFVEIMNRVSNINMKS